MALPLTHPSRRQAWLGLAFISPWLIGLLLFKILPMLASLVIAFTNFYVIKPNDIHFVGLENFWRAIRDLRAGAMLFSTLGLGLLILPAQLLLALGFAALLNNKRLVGRNILRALLFIPTIVPTTAVFLIAFGFLDPNTGWLNLFIMRPLGLPPVGGLFGESGYNFLILLLALWAIGPSFLIMLGAMQGVPVELYEAARVDGAGPINRFIKITLPSISSAIFFSLVIGLISVFGGTALLDKTLTFSGGTSAYDNYISDILFQDMTYGYGAALAWVFFIVMLAVVFLLFRTARYWVYYADGDHSL